jgi:hypothetical protein
MTPPGAPGVHRGGDVVLGRTLKAIGIVVGGLVAGAVLWGTGHWVIGVICAAAAVPAALVAWIVADD